MGESGKGGRVGKRRGLLFSIFGVTEVVMSPLHSVWRSA